CFFPAIPPEITMKQIHHRPQMPALFHIDLKQIAEIVEGRACSPQEPLLLDRSGLRIALRHNNAPQSRPMFSRDFLPCGLSLAVPEIHLSVFIPRCQENSPAVLRHPHVSEIRPAVAVHTDRGPKIYL